MISNLLLVSFSWICKGCSFVRANNAYAVRLFFGVWHLVSGVCIASTLYAALTRRIYMLTGCLTNANLMRIAGTSFCSIVNCMPACSFLMHYD